MGQTWPGGSHKQLQTFGHVDSSGRETYRLMTMKIEVVITLWSTRRFLTTALFKVSHMEQRVLLCTYQTCCCISEVYNCYGTSGFSHLTHSRNSTFT